MIWNFDGKVTVAEFEYSSAFKEYKYCINGYTYVWEAGFRNGGPWAWYRNGYTKEWARWVKI